jgi:hypothetical protein
MPSVATGSCVFPFYLTKLCLYQHLPPSPSLAQPKTIDRFKSRTSNQNKKYVVKFIDHYCLNNRKLNYCYYSYYSYYEVSFVAVRGFAKLSRTVAFCGCLSEQFVSIIVVQVGCFVSLLLLSLVVVEFMFVQRSILF